MRPATASSRELAHGMNQTGRAFRAPNFVGGWFCGKWLREPGRPVLDVCVKSGGFDFQSRYKLDLERTAQRRRPKLLAFGFQQLAIRHALHKLHLDFGFLVRHAIG